MNPAVSLRRMTHRINKPSMDGAHARRERESAGPYGKPTLSAVEYMNLLNERLRGHPMYLEGMHFPYPQPGSTPMLAAAVAWEGPWDCLGVFASVIDEVASEYELAAPERVRLGQYYPPSPAASAQHRSGAA